MCKDLDHTGENCVVAPLQNINPWGRGLTQVWEVNALVASLTPRVTQQLLQLPVVCMHSLPVILNYLFIYKTQGAIHNLPTPPHFIFTTTPMKAIG